MALVTNIRLQHNAFVPPASRSGLQCAQFPLPLGRIVAYAETGPNGVLADRCLTANDLARAGRSVNYGSGFFVVAAIPAARNLAIRLISFAGTGLASGKWTVPFRSSKPLSSSSSVAKNVPDAANNE